MKIIIQYYCIGDSFYLPPDVMSQYTGKAVDKGLSVKMRKNRHHFQHLDKFCLIFTPFGLKHLGPLMTV